MGRVVCPIQYLCPKVNLNGTMQDEWHRSHIPCAYFLDMTCEKSLDIQLFLGDEIACEISKIKRWQKTAPQRPAESE